MTVSIRGALSVALAMRRLSPAPPPPFPSPSTLRVEGATSTIFDGPVTTDGHSITTASSGGPQPCDGTNGGAFPSAGPDRHRRPRRRRPAQWLQPGTRLVRLVQRLSRSMEVGRRPANTTQFWGLVSSTSSSPRPAAAPRRSSNGDEVLWVFDAFSKTHVLKLTGPAAATTGAPSTVKVVDGQNGSPPAGATVNGATTGADGKATLSFAERGRLQAQGRSRRLGPLQRAQRSASTRRRRPCTSGDKAGPERRSEPAGPPARQRAGRSRTMLISWQASDANGAGVSYYSVDVREVPTASRPARPATGSRSWSAPPSPACTSAATPAAPTSSASPRVDRAANRTVIVTDPLVLPVDDRDRGLWKLSRGWKRTARPAPGAPRSCGPRGRARPRRCASPAARSR